MIKQENASAVTNEPSCVGNAWVLNSSAVKRTIFAARGYFSAPRGGRFPGRIDLLPPRPHRDDEHKKGQSRDFRDHLGEKDRIAPIRHLDRASQLEQDRPDKNFVAASATQIQNPRNSHSRSIRRDYPVRRQLTHDRWRTVGLWAGRQD